MIIDDDWIKQKKKLSNTSIANLRFGWNRIGKKRSKISFKKNARREINVVFYNLLPLINNVIRQQENNE